MTDDEPLDAFDTQVDRAEALMMVWMFCPMFSFMLIYLLGSFTAGDTNPVNWTATSRAWAILPWLIITGITLIVSHVQLDTWANSKDQVEYWKKLHAKACEVNAELSSK